MSDSPIKRMTTAAQRIGEAALQLQAASKHEKLGLNHWLLTILERHGAMVEGMLPGFRLDETKKDLRARLAKNEIGMPLDEAAAVEQAEAFARRRSKTQAAERDLAAAVLTLAGFTPEAVAAGAPAVSTPTAATDPAAAPAEGKIPPPATPTLDKFGSDLTKKAREGKLPPLIGREEELQLMVETLCRRTKRNPVLIGPAGVGKTAIVEGLAQRVVEGKVPALLRNVRIVALQPSNLVAGSEMRGDFEKRMQTLIQEASQPDLILFIDEIHSMMGAGGTAGSTDFASILKPSLARGDLAVIAATTDAEHRRFIEEDAALERRFQPVRVQELTSEQTFQVLVGLREMLVRRYSIQAPDEVLRWLIQFANQYMHNRFFPDKAVDLLEQSYAHAAVSNKTTVELEDAQNVAQRMVGMPLDLETRITSLQRLLNEESNLTPEQIETLANRLRVTLRGMDLRSARPNATVLLCGAAAEQVGQLAGTLAAALFGAENRVISIDMSRILQREDINLLVGAPPGYVGYEDALPLHGLAQMPWCVLVFDAVDACHPSARALLAQSISNGFILDGHGKPLYLSDTVILLTASVHFETQHSLGFQAAQASQPDEERIIKAIVDAVGMELAAQIDLVIAGTRPPSETTARWLMRNFLPSLAARYKTQGLEVTWDESLVSWMSSSQEKGLLEQIEWERWADQDLSPELIHYLPTPGSPNVALCVKISDNKIVVDRL